MSQVICHTLQVPQLWKIWGYVALHFAGMFGHFPLLCMYLALPLLLRTLFQKKLVRYCYLYMGTLGLGEVTVWIRNGRVTTRMHGSCSL